MRTFLVFVLKEFLHISRDTRTMLILIVLPIAQLLLFGYALNTDVTNLKVAIVNQDKGTFSHKLEQAIVHNPYFLFQSHYNDLAQIDPALRRGAIDLAVIIPPGLERNRQSGLGAKISVRVNAGNPNMGTIASGYIQSIVGGLLQESSRQAMPFGIRVEQRMLFNSALNSAYHFVPGVMGLVLIIICSIMTSVSIVREKETGSMEVLLASPLNSYTMMLAKMVPYLVISMVNLASFLIVSTFLLGVPIRGDLLPLCTLSLSYILLALAIGLFVSTVATDQAAAIMIAGIGMMLPTLVLSGMIFPLANMPTLLQWLAQIVPAKWYVDGVRRIMIQGSGWSVIWLHHTVLLGMATLLASLSIFKLKPRLG